MAAYQFLTSEATLKVLSPELVQDAQRITARASESGVVYSLVFSDYPTDPTGRVIWTPQLIADQLAYWAGLWDQNSLVPGVVGIGLTQELNAASELVEIALVTVQSTSGRSTTTATLGPRSFLPEPFATAVAAVRQQLDADEAGG